MSDDLSKLIADLKIASAPGGRGASGGIMARVRDAAVKSGDSVARTAAAAAVRGPHTPKFADSIKARKPRESGTSVSVSVEPLGGRQAKLGAILEFGTSTSGPHPVLGNALHDEEPVFVSRMQDVGDSFL